MEFSQTPNFFFALRPTAISSGADTDRAGGERWLSARDTRGASERLVEVVGAVDLAFALNPITAAGMLISNVIDAGVGATLGEEYAPGVHQVLYNAGRTAGALADEAVSGGESGAIWRLAEEMSSGHHGGITRQFAEDGEWWGDWFFDTFLKPTGDDNPYRP